MASLESTTTFLSTSTTFTSSFSPDFPPSRSSSSCSIVSTSFSHSMGDMVPRPPPLAARKSFTTNSVYASTSYRNLKEQPENIYEEFGVLGDEDEGGSATTSERNRGDSAGGKEAEAESSKTARRENESGSSSPRKRRRMFYAVKEGHNVGVYQTWEEAEEQIKGHPSPLWKTFKTPLAAEAYVAGSSVYRNNQNYDPFFSSSPPPPSSPPSPSSPRLPLHEHLSRNFPSTPAASAPSVLLPPLEPPRPPFVDQGSARRGRRDVRRSSPLRQEVPVGNPKPDGSGAAVADVGERNSGKRKTWNFSRLSQGFLVPPNVPEKVAKVYKQSRVEEIERTGTSLDRVLPELPGGLSTPAESIISSRSSSRSRPTSLRTLSAPPPRSESPSTLRSHSSHPRQSSGLWADAMKDLPLPQIPLSPPPELVGAAADLPISVESDMNLAASAPKFSRTALKKANIAMPLSAGQVSPERARSPSGSRRPSLRRQGSSTSMMSSISSGSIGSLHEKLMALSTNFNDKGGLAEMVEEERQKERTWSQWMQKQPSDSTDSSFPTSATTSPPLPPAPLNTKDLPEPPSGASSLTLSPELLTPIHSHTTSDRHSHEGPIVMDSESSAAHSIVTHALSDGCLGQIPPRTIRKEREIQEIVCRVGKIVFKIVEGKREKKRY